MLDTLTLALTQSAARLSDTPSAAGDGALVQVLLRVLDEMDCGVILVDARLRIRHANHLARCELGDQRALHASGLRLHACDPEQQDLLVQAVSRAAQGQRSMIELGRGRDQLPLALVPLVRPARQTPDDGGSILVLCGKRQLCESLALQFYAKARKLSAGELGVLQALCAGLRVREIAAQNGVAESTVRSHITSLRQKTGVTSIRDLVNKVSALPPMVSSLRSIALQ